MRIGIDIMGGDFAPEATVSGTFLARKEIPEDVQFFLFGDEKSIIRKCSDNGFDVNGMEIIHTTEQISMSDHPYKSFISKKDSSIYKGFQYLKSEKIDAFCSAGNTGAMMVGASQVINSIPGIIRPSVAAQLPNINGSNTVILDVGLNPDSRPDVLYQYGKIGSAYYKSLFQKENPGVGLINIGTEEEKGNLAVKSAYQLMNDNNEYDFVGNIETNNIFSNPEANVLVCDGFVGNVIIKEAEAFYGLLKSRKIDDDFFEIFNFEKFGGLPLLGVNKPVVVGHGISNEIAIKNMILHSWEVTRNNLINNIKEAIQ
jgi:glycerol-3-phosphate acyltransferase PlsX